jgi:hypothetical protein
MKCMYYVEFAYTLFKKIKNKNLKKEKKKSLLILKQKISHVLYLYAVDKAKNTIVN